MIAMTTSSSMRVKPRRFMIAFLSLSSGVPSKSAPIALDNRLSKIAQDPANVKSLLGVPGLASPLRFPDTGFHAPASLPLEPLTHVA
jgi:hypothetical protein